jgi:hypothetical protein
MNFFSDSQLKERLAGTSATAAQAARVHRDRLLLVLSSAQHLAEMGHHGAQFLCRCS